MQIRPTILAPFLVDAYSLGAHWIYDEQQLKSLDLNWSELNDAKAQWHKGKVAGDFTHYGDHTLWLLEFVVKEGSFDVVKYASYWREKMLPYEGYVDGSSRECIEHLDCGNSARMGVVNHDLSICGRIAPLLLVTNDEVEFVSASISFAKLTHNDPTVLEAVHFFATLLYALLNGTSLKLSLERLLPNYSETISTWIHQGIDSKDEDTFQAIREFGPACGVEGGFAGVLHLISKYDNLKDMMIENAKAGGDSSARGMVAAMIISAWEIKEYDLQEKINAYKEIYKLLKKVADK
jgi:ADP-ribosylglycohydrolase